MQYTKLKRKTWEDGSMQSLGIFSINGVCVRCLRDKSVWSYVPCEFFFRGK